VIELDRQFAQVWRDRGVTVIEADALKIEWGQIPLTGKKILVSNLPYQISSSLVIDRSVQPDGVWTMVLMFQKEVAQRMLARPNTESYSLVSVIAQSAWKIEKVMEISSKDFFPPPQVASQVLRFSSLGKGLPPSYLNFVKLAFAHRRKLLIRNISGLAESAVLEDVWERLKIAPKARPEDLNPAQYQSLFDALQAKKAEAK
jgi:16S rRNA (adenine1518-N6/adenine1519-N6)-dimethyltransferase